MGINQWQDNIDRLQTKDIKRSRHITEEFRDFTHKGLFFSFNIVSDKSGTIFDDWKKKDLWISTVFPSKPEAFRYATLPPVASNIAFPMLQSVRFGSNLFVIFLS